MDDPAEYRREARFGVKVWGRYLLPSGVRKDVLLKELSETGCRFFDKFSSLRPGEEISLRIENMGPFRACIRWVDRGIVGAEFEHRIYGPIFEHIRDKLGRPGR
jgi:hypothetical protein